MFLLLLPIVLLFFFFFICCGVTRSSPRRRADYRFRTPKNADVIQVPSAQTGFVTAFVAQKTGPKQLTVDFDCPISEIGSCYGLLVTTLTILSQSWDAFIDNGTAPNVITDLSADAAPGFSRLQLDYNDLADDIDLDVNFFMFSPGLNRVPIFVARLPFTGADRGYLLNIQPGPA